MSKRQCSRCAATERWKQAEAAAAAVEAVYAEAVADEFVDKDKDILHLALLFTHTDNGLFWFAMSNKTQKCK